MSGSWVHTGYAQRIVFGAGSVERVGELCAAVGMRRALLVTTEGRAASAGAARLVAAAGAAGVSVSVFAGVRPHVPTSAVDEAVARAGAEGVDGVVSFGGGSCADLAKAVCFAAEQRAGPESPTWADRPVLPHVSVPTTYSGAELTPFFGSTDEATRRKRGTASLVLAPAAAVYDPVLTLGTPPRVSAETGMNALAHGVECAYSPTRSPEAEALALSCVERVAAALPLVVDDPADLDARTAMLEGAVLGGRCLQNASMGVHHGLSQLLGGRTGLPHGLVNALVLPHALRFNLDAIGDMAGRLGTALGDPSDPAGAAARLRERLGLPATLAECGVTADDVDAAAEASPGNGNVTGNVRPVSVDDARAILTAAVTGTGAI